jgi:hypothetical protein
VHTKFDIYVLIDMIIFTNRHTLIAALYPQNNPSIDINTSQAPRTGIIDLRLIIITYNRPWSLERLLTSLNEAEYFNNMVVIEV